MPKIILITLFFVLQNNFPDHNNQLYVNFKANDVQLDRYVVRPIITNGTIKIFNSSNLLWVNGTDVWSSMPFLDSNLILKVEDFISISSEVSFEIMDLSSGDTYKTAKVKIWNSNILKNYIQDLNQQGLKSKPKATQDLMSVVEDATVAFEQSTESVKPITRQNNLDITKNTKTLIHSLLTFLLFVFVGLYSDKIHK